MSHASEIPSPKYPVLNRVVDSLDFRVYRDQVPSSWLSDSLNDIREILATYRPGEVKTMSLPGLGRWQVRHSRQPVYEFKLQNNRIADIYIWNPEKWRGNQIAQTGQFYVSFRSVFLQAGGIPAALRFIDALTALMLDPAPLGNRDAKDFDRISRADISVDYSDLTFHDLNKKEQQEHCVIPWAELDNYQARGKRLKREPWLTPFNQDTREILAMLLKRAKATKSQIAGILGHDFMPLNPQLDNKGGHCDTNQRNGFSGGSVGAPIESEFDALAASLETPTTLALERGLDLFGQMLLEGVETDGNAYTTRVIGSRRGAQTVYFGRFGSSLYAREYNKLASIFSQEKSYMLDVWLKNGWDGVAPVWRCEYSMSGDFLQQFIDTASGERMDLRAPRDFQIWLPRVWAYLTRTWLRHTVPNLEDKNRSRWDASERWRSIQNAWGADAILNRVKKPPSPTSNHLQAGIQGYAKSITALESANPEIVARALSKCGFNAIPDTEDYARYRSVLLELADYGTTLNDKPKKRQKVLKELEQNKVLVSKALKKCGFDRIPTTTDYKTYKKTLLELTKESVLEMFSEFMTGEDSAGFDFDVLERQVLFGVDPDSDTAFSSMLRSERMKEGGGS